MKNIPWKNCPMEFFTMEKKLEPAPNRSQLEPLDLDGPTRAAALEVLVRGATEPGGGAHGTAAIWDPEPWVQRAAVRALGICADASDAPTRALFAPLSRTNEPPGAVWRHADDATAMHVPSHGYVEVTHCARTRGAPGGDARGRHCQRTRPRSSYGSISAQPSDELELSLPALLSALANPCMSARRLFSRTAYVSPRRSIRAL